jgi:ankyrin repeat protein
MSQNKKNAFNVVTQKENNAKIPARAIFLMAVKNGDKQTALCHLKSKKNIPLSYLENALTYAASTGYTDIVDILIEYGTPLHLVENGHFPILDTALNCAIGNGFFDTANLLLKNGADPLYISASVYMTAYDKFGSKKIETFLSRAEAKQKALRENHDLPDIPLTHQDFLKTDAYGNTLVEQLCAHGYISELFDMRIWHDHMNEIENIWKNHVPAIYKKDFNFYKPFKHYLNLKAIHKHKTPALKRRPRPNSPTP